MNQHLVTATTAVVSLVSTVIHADDAQPLAETASLKAEARVAFTEGPVWHPTGNVYFSDIANNTAGHKLWSIPTKAAGHVIWPKQQSKQPKR